MNKITTYIGLFIFLVAFVCINNISVSAATVEDMKWSFDFKDVTVSEVLNAVEKSSGIEIVVDGDMETHPVTKSYQNDTIDDILLDIFNDENHVLLFQYDNFGLRAVNIWVLPQGEGGVFYSNISSNKSLPLPVTTKKNTGRILKNRYKRNNFRTVGSINNDKNNLTRISKGNSYSSVSYRKEKNTTSANSAETDNSNSGTDDTPTSPNTSEAVDITPLPELVTTLGLEPPPMPPGMFKEEDK